MNKTSLQTLREMEKSSGKERKVKKNLRNSIIKKDFDIKLLTYLYKRLLK